MTPRGGVIPVVHPKWMSYLFYYTKQIQNTKGGTLTSSKDFGYILLCKSFTNYNQMFIEIVGSEVMVV